MRPFSCTAIVKASHDGLTAGRKCWNNRLMGPGNSSPFQRCGLGTPRSVPQEIKHFCSQDGGAEFVAAEVFVGGCVAGDVRDEHVAELRIKHNRDRDARIRAAQERWEGNLSSSHFLDSNHVTSGSDSMAGGETPTPVRRSVLEIFFQPRVPSA